MNLITFDVEDWFHILEHDATRTQVEWAGFSTRIHESVERILTLLSRHKVKATFFCMGWMAERYPEVIRQIHGLGHEIGSHSYAHQLVSGLTFGEAQEDIGRSIGILEDLCGEKVKSYRAPGFSMTRKTPWLVEILHAHGIEFDCSISSARTSHGGEGFFGIRKPQLIRYQGVTLKEFPLNVWEMRGVKVLFSGGGYFRLLPYWLISRLMRRSDYVMTYFHPRDFDPDQPVIQDLSLFRKLKSYYGLTTSHAKLSRLLQDFEFLSVCAADERIDWSHVPVFDLGRGETVNR